MPSTVPPLFAHSLVDDPSSSPRRPRIFHPHLTQRSDMPESFSPSASDRSTVTLDGIACGSGTNKGTSSNIAEPHQLADGPNQSPPSFAQSEFETIIRRQRNNTVHGLKIVSAPSRFPHVGSDWEFSGWGSVSYSEISKEALEMAEKRMSEPEVLIGHFRASSISGNGVVGSVFYAFPAVALAASIFSPLALLIACLILTLYRPILLELGGAIRLDGANYVYLLQTSGKTLAALGAAATLLDAVATSVVSAATAGAYLKGEISALPIQEWAIGLCLLVIITLVALVSLQESSRLTLSITVIHMTVMLILMIASMVAWARSGMDVMRGNWELRPKTGSAIARSIFDGICIAFLGVTGFECTPAYIQNIKPEAYAPTLRNLLVMAISLNVPLMLLVYALLPSETILGGANVLSSLAEVSIGQPLRIVVVTDCVLVLSGGIFAGVTTGCKLIESLAHDHILPHIFLAPLPVTGSAYVTVITFLALSFIVYATSGFSLPTVSAMFSGTFLCTMLLYGVSCLLLKISCSQLPRPYTASLWTVFAAMALVLVMLGGNFAMKPDALGLFAAYLSVILAVLMILNSRLKIARAILWVFGQSRLLRRRQFDRTVIRWIRQVRSKPIVVWVKTDHINQLVQAMLYVQRNEPTSRVMFVHAYIDARRIPSELEANVKILDEAFPSTTLDLIFMKGRLGPTLVDAASHKFGVTKNYMFMSCPGPDHPWHLNEYKGVRIIDF